MTPDATTPNVANAPAVVSRVPSSFRDPSGFMFVRGGVLYRQVQTVYREHYERLVGSGLLAALVRDRLVVPHDEVDTDLAAAPGAFKVLRPRVLKIISYPYEWSFGQLKAAALLTLEVHRRAFEHGMVLKDASAYNVQFEGSSAVLIDVLSFENYVEGEPWAAYRQFCQHFLAPLALMAYVDVRLGQLMRVHLDGVPLDLASRVLPVATWVRPSLAMHIHGHAKAQRRYANASTSCGKSPRARAPKVSRHGFLGILSSLEAAVTALTWNPQGTEWADYYATFRYSEAAFAHKRELVDHFFEAIHPQPTTVVDLGANTGVFSRSLADKGAQVVAIDLDPAAVERNYRECVKERRSNLLPLVLDLTNPSPGLGWATSERTPFFARTSMDLALCLALVHHLAIGSNVPLEFIAAWLHDVAPRLIIEFVPKSDEQVQRLLTSRPDIFPEYTRDGFESAFARYFVTERSQTITETGRVLYSMRRGVRAVEPAGKSWS